MEPPVDIAVSTLPTYDHVDDFSWIGSQHGLETGRPITLDPNLLTAEHMPMGWVRSGTPLGLVTATQLWGPYTGGTVDEVQTITQGGSGLTSYTLTYSGQTTASIAQAATAAQVQAALVALSNIGDGDVVVTGSAGGPYTVTFAGALANTNVAQMTATPTGGSGTVTIATATAGAGDASADGREVCRGFLYGMVKPHLLQSGLIDLTKRIGAALLVPYRVRLANLPIQLDSTGQADLAARCEFI
jgi:hypothetical protein